MTSVCESIGAKSDAVCVYEETVEEDDDAHYTRPLLGGAGEDGEAIMATEEDEDDTPSFLTYASLHLLHCCQYLVFAFAVLILVLCAFEIWVYARYKDESCAEPLPLWLLVGGISGMLWTVAFTISHKLAELSSAIVCGLSTVLCFGWMTVGSIWVYSISETECAQLPYQLVWWVITASWVLFAVLVSVAFCCLFSVLCSGEDPPKPPFGFGAGGGQDSAVPAEHGTVDEEAPLASNQPDSAA